MKKSLKISLIAFLLLAFAFIPVLSYAADNSDTGLVEDNAIINGLPKNFRKCTDPIALERGEILNTSGLDKLNISGSAQFSKPGIFFVKAAIGTNLPITIVDLREESHGFINDVPVSWKNSINNANMNLTTEQIMQDENQKLNAIPLNTSIAFSNKKSITATSVQNELTLVNNNGLSYVRIPVTDRNLPTQNDVNAFVSFVQNQAANTFLHFHCKAGIGRTTTFMIMYDIMKNGNSVNLKDIITRQVKLSGMSYIDSQDFYSGNRFDFFTSFYNTYKG